MFIKLLFINGLFTAIGGMLLIAIPGRLMKLFGVQLPSQDFFIAYLLGVTSLSFSVLSFFAMKFVDRGCASTSECHGEDFANVNLIAFW